jgi:hypothetical protein
MNKNLTFRILLTVSLILAAIGFESPDPSSRPLDYGAMLTVALPLAAAWIVVLAVSLRWCAKRALWLLLGAPMALWWPIWLLFNRFPPCYYAHRCF